MRVQQWSLLAALAIVPLSIGFASAEDSTTAVKAPTGKLCANQTAQDIEARVKSCRLQGLGADFQFNKDKGCYFLNGCGKALQTETVASASSRSSISSSSTTVSASTQSSKPACPFEEVMLKRIEECKKAGGVPTVVMQSTCHIYTACPVPPAPSSQESHSASSASSQSHSSSSLSSASSQPSSTPVVVACKKTWENSTIRILCADGSVYSFPASSSSSSVVTNTCSAAEQAVKLALEALNKNPSSLPLQTAALKAKSDLLICRAHNK